MNFLKRGLVATAGSYGGYHIGKQNGFWAIDKSVRQGMILNGEPVNKVTWNNQKRERYHPMEFIPFWEREGQVETGLKDIEGISHKKKIMGQEELSYQANLHVSKETGPVFRKRDVAILLTGLVGSSVTNLPGMVVYTLVTSGLWGTFGTFDGVLQPVGLYLYRKQEEAKNIEATKKLEEILKIEEGAKVEETKIEG